ncbi:MAG TPA: phosphoribosylformylglycinamidine synthase subunit PurQ [Candidatus Angelobacter sp.]|nr:phosphoribosylformylglycinamidine synthase subunit PurQ [Candidatus Angelobacter sp.]
MKFGVVVFPGSNCDHDSYHAAVTATGSEATFLWHESHDLQNCDAIVVPGGFAYGDYLRTGAIAKFAPIMQEIARFSASGGLVIGICNGFQILCEAGLLPGALMRNAGLKYICRQVHLRVESTDTPYTGAMKPGVVLQMPIGHMDGNFYCDPKTLAELKNKQRIVFRYSTPTGEITPEANPNGSLENIAGICNEGRNVLGMMPHPDRASESLLGSSDGAAIFRSMASALAGASR